MRSEANLHGPRGGALKTTSDSGTDAIAGLRSEFERRFCAAPSVFRAPGRVNLIGEHTDYNQGFVMPCAIQFATCVAASPRDDGRLTIHSLDFGEQREFDLADSTRRGNWTDYIRGVALVLASSGLPIRGANLLIHGDVPIGAGLSSSASVEVATALALLATSALEVDGPTLALLCQRAENEFVGAHCGIMDQFVSANGAAGNALMLDCRTLDFTLLPIPDDVRIVICNSMVKHQLSGGEYNVRRRECEEGVRILKAKLLHVSSLRDVTANDLEANKSLLPEVVYRRCRHVVTENARVLAMADALTRRDLNRIGELMAESHRSLRDDYEVSCAELDLLVELAGTAPGVIGSRMTGGGFGGCTVNLVRSDAVEQVRSSIAKGYEQRTGIRLEIYVSAAADGARRVA